MLVLTDSELHRLAEKFVFAPNGCWEWKSSLTWGGYGQICFRYRTIGAHRLMYRLLVGEIPDGLTIDHLCNNPSCVNPSHLEPVPMATNLMRAKSRSRLETPEKKNGRIRKTSI